MSDRVLVTGGAGFIGSHLVDALVAAKRQVRVLDNFASGKRANLNAAAELVEGDLRDPAAVLAAFDNDRAGERLYAQLSERLPPYLATLERVRSPIGKDWNDYLQRKDRAVGRGKARDLER